MGLAEVKASDAAQVDLPNSSLRNGLEQPDAWCSSGYLITLPSRHNERPQLKPVSRLPKAVIKGEVLTMWISIWVSVVLPSHPIAVPCTCEILLSHVCRPARAQLTPIWVLKMASKSVGTYHAAPIQCRSCKSTNIRLVGLIARHIPSIFQAAT